MTADQHIEETLNRAGGTISDLPTGVDYTIQQEQDAMEAAADFGCGLEAYILHLVDIIDRYDEALTRLCDLRDRHMHLIGNVDPPEGVTHEQLVACIEAIIDATEKYRAGLEPWDDWSKDYVER